MRKACPAIWVCLAALLFPVQAIAQESADASGALAFRKWDVGGSFGILFARYRGEPAFQGNSWAWNVDVGRYLTAHLKADAGLMLTGPHSDIDPREFPVSGLPPAYGYVATVQRTVRPTSLSGAATYQFGENAFMHPYVSAGVRLIWQTEHSFRAQQTVTLNRVSYMVPAVDERNTSLVARPFITAGCKSYFNERTFMRSEGLVALGPQGVSHATLRIGAGIDF